MVAQRYWQMQQTVALDPVLQAVVNAILAGGITDIKNKTDSLTFTVAGQVDANIQYVNDVAVVGTGADGDTWGPA